MRICIVSDLYYPYPGGIPEHVHHTMQELNELGHTTTILTTNYEYSRDENPYLSEMNRNIIRVGRALPLPINESIGIIPVGFGLARKVKKIILEGNFDIIHMHGMNPFLPILATRYSSAVNILTFHCSSPELKIQKYIAYSLQPYIKKADGVIAVSYEALETLERFVGKNHKIIPEHSMNMPTGLISGKFINVMYAVIPNGIDTERFSPNIEPIPRFKDGGPNILFVGRNEPRKGLKYLLLAFPKVRAKIPSARLIVVGKGSRVQEFKDSNVYFEGYVSVDAIPRYYASCDVYCSPATGRESFGIVLLEAMSTGKPVVASNIPGYREVVTHGKEGLLVEPLNPSALADALIEVLTNDELKMRLSREGRYTALKYSWDKVIRKIEQFYYRVKDFKNSDGLKR